MLEKSYFSRFVSRLLKEICHLIISAVFIFIFSIVPPWLCTHVIETFTRLILTTKPWNNKTSKKNNETESLKRYFLWKWMIVSKSKKPCIYLLLTLQKQMLTLKIINTYNRRMHPSFLLLILFQKYILIYIIQKYIMCSNFNDNSQDN